MCTNFCCAIFKYISIVDSFCEICPQVNRDGWIGGYGAAYICLWQSLVQIMDCSCMLTHWGRVTYICIRKLTIIGSDNGLSPERRQTIIWTNVGILVIEPLGTNFSESVIEIHTFSLKKMHLKISSVKCRPFCLGFDVLKLTKFVTTI